MYGLADVFSFLIFGLLIFELLNFELLIVFVCVYAWMYTRIRV